MIVQQKELSYELLDFIRRNPDVVWGISASNSGIKNEKDKQVLYIGLKQLGNRLVSTRRATIDISERMPTLLEFYNVVDALRDER